MATPLKHNYFLVYAPDLPNPDRAKHLALHLEQNGPLLQDGTITVGGGLLPSGTNSSDPDVGSKLVGSFWIAKAESIERVWESLKKDIFYTSGAVVRQSYLHWDHTKIKVTPVFVAIPKVE